MLKTLWCHRGLLSQQIHYNFAKFDRAKAHVNGTHILIQSEPSATSTMAKPPSLPPSPSSYPKNKKPNTLNMEKSIKPPKKRHEVSPSILPHSSTKPTNDTMVELLVSRPC